MDYGVRLPIDLVMEVERQPVVARVCREREHERDNGTAPRNRSSAVLRRLCVTGEGVDGGRESSAAEGIFHRFGTFRPRRDP